MHAKCTTFSVFFSSVGVLQLLSMLRAMSIEDVKGSVSIRKSCCWPGPVYHLCPNTNSLMTAGRLYAEGLGFVLVQVLDRELVCIPYPVSFWM